MAAKNNGTYWLYVGDVYQAKKDVDSKVSKLFKKDKPWVVSLQAGDVDNISYLAEELRTVPMFSTVKAIILNGLPKKIADIVNIIEEMPPTNHLFLICNTIDKRSKLYKLFEKNNSVVSFDVIDVDKDSDKIKLWCKKFLDSRGFSISDTALEQFIEKMGGLSNTNDRSLSANFHKMEQELNKLILYKNDGDNVIIEDEVSLLIETYGERNIFIINNSIHTGDATKALSVFHKLIAAQGKRYKKNEVCNTVLFNLLFMYKALLYMISLKNKGIRDNQIIDITANHLHSTVNDPPKFNEDGTVRVTYYSKPQLYVLKNNISSYSLGQAFQALMMTYECIEKTRSHAVIHEDLVDVLLVNLCSLVK